MLSNNQSAYADMVGNIATITSNHAYKATWGSPGGTLLIDKRNAFPTVSHRYLFRVMAKASFPAFLRTLVIRCLIGACHLIQLEQYERFGVRFVCGIPQGGKLSMLLYIIAAAPALLVLRLRCELMSIASTMLTTRLTPLTRLSASPLSF